MKKESMNIGMKKQTNYCFFQCFLFFSILFQRQHYDFNMNPQRMPRRITGSISSPGNRGWLALFSVSKEKTFQNHIFPEDRSWNESSQILTFLDTITETHRDTRLHPPSSTKPPCIATCGVAISVENNFGCSWLNWYHYVYCSFNNT